MRRSCGRLQAQAAGPLFATPRQRFWVSRSRTNQFKNICYKLCELLLWTFKYFGVLRIPRSRVLILAFRWKRILCLGLDPRQSSPSSEGLSIICRSFGVLLLYLLSLGTWRLRVQIWIFDVKVKQYCLVFPCTLRLLLCGVEGRLGIY